MTRILRQEDGFSLAELMVVCAIVGIIAAGILGVSQVSLQSYLRANALENAQTGARAGLARMTADLRMLGSCWEGATGSGPTITAAAATSITFIGDVDGDTLDNNGNENTLAAAAVAGDTAITVTRSTGMNGRPAFAVGAYACLKSGGAWEVRQITAVAGTTITLAVALATNFPAGSTVRSVQTVTYALVGTTLTRSVNGGAAAVIANGVSGLTFTYLDGQNPPVVTGVLGNIRQIQVSITTTGANGTVRVMNTTVRPRSLSL